jgi:hypothetical protein
VTNLIIQPRWPTLAWTRREIGIYAKVVAACLGGFPVAWAIFRQHDYHGAAEWLSVLVLGALALAAFYSSLIQYPSLWQTRRSRRQKSDESKVFWADNAETYAAIAAIEKSRLIVSRDDLAKMLRAIEHLRAQNRQLRQQLEQFRYD